MQTLKVPDFTSTRILIAGDLMLDRYLYGQTRRISPEAPVPVVHVGSEELRLGGAGNVALNIATLGAQVDLLSLVGDDAAANTLADLLKDADINAKLLTQRGCATVSKLRIISRNQQLIRLDYEDGFTASASDSLLPEFEKRVSQTDVVILSDYGKGCLSNIGALIEVARAAGKPVLVDPKGLDFKPYSGATLITPNLSEFEAVVGPCASLQQLVERGQSLMSDLDINALLITRGEQGMTLLQAGQEPLHLPTQAQEVYDVTGAGDTVISMFAAVLASGQSMATATALSNLAAGVVVGKLGTATVSVAEVKRALHQLQGDRTGLLDEAGLLEHIEVSRAHQERIVMTNGCFDILHPGHVRYLQQARQLGHRLVVALNDDASVSRLKGSGRPLNALADRAQVIAALDCVDWVVAFSEDTPERLICAVQPDVLVKGGDYKPDEIAGAACVKQHGGEVIVLDYHDGFSTTSLIEAIQNGQE